MANVKREHYGEPTKPTDDTYEEFDPPRKIRAGAKMKMVFRLKPSDTEVSVQTPCGDWALPSEHDDCPQCRIECGGPEL